MSTRKKKGCLEQSVIPKKKSARFHRIEELLEESPQLSRQSIPSRSTRSNISIASSPSTGSPSITKRRSMTTSKVQTKRNSEIAVTLKQGSLNSTPCSISSSPLRGTTVGVNKVECSSTSSKSASKPPRTEAPISRRLRRDDNKENENPSSKRSVSKDKVQHIASPGSTVSSKSTHKSALMSSKPSESPHTPVTPALTRCMKREKTTLQSEPRRSTRSIMLNTTSRSAKKSTARTPLPKLVFRRSGIYRAQMKNEEEAEQAANMRTPIAKLRVRKSVVNKKRGEAVVHHTASPTPNIEQFVDAPKNNKSDGEIQVAEFPGKSAASLKNAAVTPQTPLTELRKDLKDDQSVTSLRGRESEFKTIRDTLDHSIRSGDVLSMYISGAPGTGKTATTRLVLKSFGNRVHAQIVNCMAMNTQQQLLTEIFNFHGFKSKPSVSALSTLMHSLDRPMVCVLDEIDHLTSKNNNMLYSVFRWPQEISSKLILVGIANSIDLTERLLPKLKLSIPPVSIVFAPYANDTIKDILMEKMQKEESSMDSRAVELCARKVAAVSGDLRSALHFMKQAKSAALPGTPAGCREVLVALNNVYSSPLAKAKLPLQPRLLLAVCLKMSSSNKKTPLNKISLFSGYFKACEALKIPHVSADDLESAWNILESLSFVSLQGNKIRLQVDLSTAKSAIADSAMVESIFNVNL